MKGTKRVLSLILSLVLTCSSFATSAFASSDFTEETADNSVYYPETEIAAEDIAVDDGAYYQPENTDQISVIDIETYADAPAEITADAVFVSTEDTAVISETTDAGSYVSDDAGASEIITAENAEINTAEAAMESSSAAAAAENPAESIADLETEYTKIRLFTSWNETWIAFALRKAELTDEQLNEYQIYDQTILESYFFEPYPENNGSNHAELIFKNNEKTSALEKVHVYLIDHAGRFISYVGELYRSDSNSFEVEDYSGILKKAEFDFAQIMDQYGNINQPAGFAIAKTKEAAEEQQMIETSETVAEQQTAETSETVTGQQTAETSEDAEEQQTAETSELVTEHQTIESADGTVAVTGELPVDTSVEVGAADAAMDGVIYAAEITLSNNEASDIQPQEVINEVTVSVTDDSFREAAAEGGELYLYHQTADDTWEEIPDYTLDDNTISFAATELNVYAVTTTVLTRMIDASDGNTYKITVEYGSNAGIPSDAELQVEELSEEEYAAYLIEAAGVLGADLSEFSYGRLFDISIVKDGVEYQPNDMVTVTAELLDAENITDIQVVHFEDANTAEQLNSSTDGAAVTFETSGFSVFSFLDKITIKGFSLLDHITTSILGTQTGTLYENDDIILTGRMPALGIVEAERVDVTIDGQNAIVAYDINIYGGPLSRALGYTWQPEDGAVTVTIKSDALEGHENVSVYHFADGAAEPEKVADADINENSVEFQADSFSVYALGENHLRSYRFFTYNDNMEYVEYEIYTDTETTTFTQIIKNAEEGVIVPQLPSIPGNNTSTFAGWYEGSGVSFNDGVYTYTSLADEAFDFNSIPEVTETETVYLFAKFMDYAYVIFHDQYNGSANTFPVAVTRRGEKTGDPASAAIQIGDVSVAYDNDTDENSAPSMAFHGWSYTPITTPGADVDDNNDPVSRIEADTIDVTTTTHLYPIFETIHWLNYSSGPTGSGATYIPSKYYYDGEGPETLSVPVRSGYTFLGWYTGENGTGVKIADADGNLVSGANDAEAGVSVEDGKLILTQNTTIYGHWNAELTRYTVLYWQQNADDDGYSLEGFDTLYGLAGTLTNAAADKSYNHFHVSADQDKAADGDQADIVQKEIKGNGSTAVNVYYDRDNYKLWLMVGASNGNRYYYKNTNSQIQTTSDWRNLTGSGYSSFTSQTNPFTSSVYTIETEAYNGYTFYYIAVTARYEASLSGKWPTAGIGTVNGLSLNSWQMTRDTLYRQKNTSTDTIKGLFPYMSEQIITYNNASNTVDEPNTQGLTTTAGVTNILVACYPTTTSYAYEYNYYLMDPDTEQYPSVPTESVNTSATSAWNKATIVPFEGYEYVEMNHGGETSTYGGTVNLYYRPVKQQLTFMYNGETLGDDEYNYKQSLANADKYRAAAEAAAPEGYRFIGWYENSNGAGDQFDFSKATMPNAEKVLYPAYETIWYLVQIDPNYGTMNNGESDSTWFWEPYNGDPIEEYTWVTRDYVESATGTYYFTKHDRAYYGYDDEWASEEDEIKERHTYYTDDPGEATELKTFKYAKNAYRYAGWYEVDPDTGAETLYNFGEPVTHDIYLKLHWKKIGTYFVQYNPVVTMNGITLNGTLDSGDSNEELFLELDSDNYADNADVVVTRVAKAPEGYNFVGWQIRGDDSGRVYDPGETFKFLSKYSVVVNSHETIILDAVYTRVGTAKIVYNANGGSIDETVLDLGYPTESGAHEPTIDASEASSGYAVISNLVNNSEIRLSSGAGFALAGDNWSAELTGWNTEPDASGEHFDLNTAYYVDTEEPVTLYAEWKVKVYFHRNKTESRWGDAANWNGYTADGEDVYHTEVYLNQTVSTPADIPVSTADPADDLYFRHWGTIRYTDDIPEAYNFSAPVTGELHLYAYWAGPIELPIHVLDSTNENIAQADEWRRVEKINVYPGDAFAFSESDIAANYVNVPSGYKYAFAAVHNRTDSIQNISERDAVTHVYYNAAERVVYVKYAAAGKADAPLADTDEVYFVYYRQKILPIGYKLVNNDGTLTQRHADGNTGRLGEYSMPDSITAPLTLGGYSINDTTYYAYALGSENAANAAGMQIITSTTNSQSNGSRPNLQIRNTWRGYEYSLNGTSWTKCGYGSLQLYVLYFTSQPTIVMLNEETIGTAGDMDEAFEYTVTLTETVADYSRTDRYTRNGWSGRYTLAERGVARQIGSSSSTTSSLPNVSLTNGDQQSYTVFYIQGPDNMKRDYYSSGAYYCRDYSFTVTTQTITIVQSLKSGFETEITEETDGTADQPYNWSYTTSETSVDQTVTYTNTHTPLTVEVHVALVGADGITLDDDYRNTEKYSFTVPMNNPEAAANTKSFLEELIPSELFTGDESYGFAGIVYGTSGTEQGDTVTVAGSGISTVTYGNISGNIYDLFFDGDTSKTMDEYKVYYLYYPLPKLVYVKETSGGMLTRIQGSTDGSNVTDTITYNGAVQTLNGITVEQEQQLNVSTGLFTISQNGGFGILPLLDDGTEKLYLSYAKIGVAGTDSAESTSSLDAVSADKLMYLRVTGNQVKWSLDRVNWNAFTDSEPTVYAIYKELGYDLQITKTVEGIGVDRSKTFTIEISSMLITESSYSVSNYMGYPTVAATPASGSNPGTIVLTIKHGSDITIQGLPKGEYTITESNAGGAVMTAKIGDEEQHVTDNSLKVELMEDTKVDITNNMPPVAPTNVSLIHTPFILMAVLGLMLLMLVASGRGRRKEEE